MDNCFLGLKASLLTQLPLSQVVWRLTIAWLFARNGEILERLPSTQHSERMHGFRILTEIMAEHELASSYLSRWLALAFGLSPSASSRFTRVCITQHRYHSGSYLCDHTLCGLPGLCVRCQCASLEHRHLHCFHLCREDVRDVVSVKKKIHHTHAHGLLACCGST